MAFCKNCGAELNEGAKFCKLCGTPVSSEQTPQPVPVPEPSVPVIKHEFPPVIDDDDDDDDDFVPASSPFEHDKKKSLGGIWGLVLPVVIVLIGAAIYGFFKGSGEEGSSDNPAPSAKDTYHPNILPQENSYPGLWVSVGGASFAYQNLSGMSRQDIAGYIEQQMVPSDHVRYLMTDKKISVLVNGNTSLSGEYIVLDSNDLAVVTPSGEEDTIWMYVTGKDEFYTYIKYRGDDGTEMCSAMKMRRNR